MGRKMSRRLWAAGFAREAALFGDGVAVAGGVIPGCRYRIPELQRFSRYFWALRIFSR